MSNFEDDIKEWVSIDNELKKINERAKELREKKANKTELIVDYVEELNTNPVVQISDGQLRFITSKYTSPLTFKHVQSCLERCLNNKEDVDYIIKYIKESRTTTHSLDIKRLYN